MFYNRNRSFKTKTSAPQRGTDQLLLLMSVFSQALLALVSCHFVFLSFLTTGHNAFGFVSRLVGMVEQKFISLNHLNTNLLWLAQQGPHPFALLFQTVGALFPFSPHSDTQHPAATAPAYVLDLCPPTLQIFR